VWATMCTNASVLPTLPECTEEACPGLLASNDGEPQLTTLQESSSQGVPCKATRKSVNGGSAFGGAETGNIMDKGPRISQASTAASTQVSSSSEAWTASVQARIEQEVARHLQAVSKEMEVKHRESEMQVEALRKRSEELQREVEQLPRQPRRSSVASSTGTPRQCASWAPPLAPMTPRSEQVDPSQARNMSPLQCKQRRYSCGQKPTPRNSAAHKALRRSSTGTPLELDAHRQWMMEQRQNLLQDLYPDGQMDFPNRGLSMGVRPKMTPAV